MSIAPILCAQALKLPGTIEDVACEGTALESRSFKVNGKAFLFVGMRDARLKSDGKWIKLELATARPRAELAALVSASYAAFASGSAKPAAPPGARATAKKSAKKPRRR